MREIRRIDKQSKGVAHYDKVHSPAKSCEEKNRSQLPIFHLREWNEARGVLRRINLEDGSIAFEGFIVRMPPSLLALLFCLHDSVGQKISILRTDSMTHPLVVRVIQSGSQECLGDDVCHESNGDKRCLEPSM